MTGGPEERREIEHLLDELSSGDSQTAWDVFLSNYSDLIFRVLSFLDPDPDNRSDSFLYACEQLHRKRFRRLRQFQPDGPASFSTWLRAVIRNLYLDWRRKRYGPRSWLPTVSLDRSRTPDAPPSADSLSDQRPDPEITASHDERKTQLEEALQQLAPSEIRILELRFEEDLTLDQIGRVIGLGSPQSVRYRLQKILEKLRRQLQ